MSSALRDVISVLDIWTMLSPTLSRALYSRDVRAAGLLFISEFGDGLVWPLPGRQIEQVFGLAADWTGEHPERIVTALPLAANVVGLNGPLIGPAYLAAAEDEPVPYLLTDAGLAATGGA